MNQKQYPYQWGPRTTEDSNFESAVWGGRGEHRLWQLMRFLGDAMLEASWNQPEMASSGWKNMQWHLEEIRALAEFAKEAGV